MSCAKEREPYVKALEDLCGAKRFEGLSGEKLGSFLPGQVGCFKSHYAIYKKVPKGEDVLIFEDDCVVIDPTVFSLLDELKPLYDIIYLGCYHIYKKRGLVQSHGTYAYWLSSNALSILLNNSDMQEPIDHHLCSLEHSRGLRVWRPTPKDKYVKQQCGLRSLISGGLRKDKID